MKRLRVLIADDNDTFRCIIVELLCNSYQVIGAVCDGDELIQSALCLDPDVVVSNILMPGMDGLAAREMLIAAERAIPFVFVSELGKELLVLQFPHNQSPVARIQKRTLGALEYRRRSGPEGAALPLSLLPLTSSCHSHK